MLPRSRREGLTESNERHATAAENQPNRSTINMEDNKRNIVFTDFMVKNINISKVDDYMMINGIVSPTAAMIAKRTCLSHS
ncbi:hypothetical protein MTR_8g021220 [Medicago truncatula]|uniref:Uncharacterized protein n=1 Tax=Medicago truncatula TaxID=3880 RepID=G7L7M2_MEDTR|nr:hypothetical protein MTR_8g021220 [Medicago truncatula]